MTGPSNMGTTPSPCAVTTAKARRKSLPKRRRSRMGQPGYTARHRCFRGRPQRPYQVYLAESNQPPFGKLEPLPILKTNPDGAGIVQAIGPLKVLAGNDPNSSASQRFLIVTDIKDSSQGVLRQTNADEMKPAGPQ